MNIIILAAGQGKRLGKLTYDTPKCLLDFGGKSILERQIEILNLNGIQKNNIFIVLGYRAEQVINEFGNKANIIINNEYYCTDNAYSLGLAFDYISKNCDKDDVMVLDGDIIFEEDVFKKVLSYSYKNLLFGKESKSSYNSTGIEIDSKGNVKEIGKHIKNSNITYLSIMKLSHEYMLNIKDELLDNKNKRNWYTVVINKLLSLLPFKCVLIDGRIDEVNTYYDLVKAKDNFNIKNFKIILTGASGLLGKKIYSILSRDYEVIGIQNKSLFKNFHNIDLMNEKDLNAFVYLNRPDIIIHTAAIADPDKCEKDRNLAYDINVETTRILCKICKKYNIKLILISTDYVFDGEKGSEYNINDVYSPKNYYGYTKQLSEILVKEEVPEHLIIRIPIIYGFNGEDDKDTFFTNVVKHLKEGKELFLDDIQIRYPVLIDEVAMAIAKCLPLNGIIHMSSQKGVTKYNWAKEIARAFGYDKNLINKKNNVDLKNRPLHVKLKNSVDNNIFEFSDVYKGALIVKKQMNCVFKLIYKSQPIDEINNVNIGEFRYNLGKKLGKEIDKNILSELDYIVPVPSSGLFYAMGLAEETGIPYMQGLVKSETTARSFNIMDLGLREKIIRSKIMPVKNILKGKNIALVDEAIFTGTTLRITCDILKACGVNQIHICIPTPISFFRCEQYVQPSRVLLSENISTQKISEYFRVESVTFLYYNTFIEYLDNNCGPMCYDCFINDERKS